MLWLIIPLLTWVVYILFFKKQTAAAGGAREVVKDFKPKKVLSDAAERFRKTFSLDETNKPICISLRKVRVFCVFRS